MTFVDAVERAKEEEAAGRVPFIAFHGVEVREDGHEYISWVKRGQQNPPRNDCRVDRMPRYYATEWQVLKPTYDAYKSGEEAPVDGTPLSAWPGVNKHIVKLLNERRVRSVEDFAKMPDHDVGTIPLPGIREKHRNAKAFVDNKNNLSGLVEENTNLKSRLEFLEQAYRELKADVPDPEKRKGGWPKGKPRKPAEHNPDNDGTRVA
jgi:hypothetical protein